MPIVGRPGADIRGHLEIAPTTVITILDQEGRKAMGQATRLLAKAINEASPVGPARDPHRELLSSSHKASIARTEYGVRGRVKRKPEAWYGRIVETGRRGGNAKKGRRRRGARVGKMDPNPFVDQAAIAVEPAADALLEAGAARAAKKIEKRLVSG